MNRFCFVVIVYLLAIPVVSGQLEDDFNDGSLTNNVLWDGDIEDFIINKELQLQLSAEEAGNSYIHAPLYLEGDSTVFRLDFGMQFKPSSGNKLRIYLALDKNTIDSANGYFIEIGENGTKDAIQFFRLEAGAETLVARGIDGRFAGASKMTFLEVQKFDEVWSIHTKQSTDGQMILELVVPDTTFDLKETRYFGIECLYTSTRKNKFFFDNVNIDKYKPDTQAPHVERVTVIDDTHISIRYSEKMDSLSIIDIHSYTVDDLTVASVEAYPTLQQVVLTAAKPFDASQPHILHVHGPKDVSGNHLQKFRYDFLYARPAYTESIILSELLTDPYPEGEDFIELYNPTNQYISMVNCTLYNSLNDKKEIIIDDLILEPYQFVALSPDTVHLIDLYMPEEGNLFVQKLPALNNASANITLISSDGDTIDAYNYDESQHFPLLKDTEGVSMERIDLTYGSAAWHSASSSTRYATPGYKNSNTFQGALPEQHFSLGQDAFSPDNDGYQDLMPILYTLDRPGYMASIKIYTAEGVLVTTLLNNQLLGTSGTYTWDGITSKGKRAPMGHYIVLVEAWHPDGTRHNYKEAFALVYPF